MLAVFCAATLALMGCSDSGGSSKVTEPVGAGDGGGGGAGNGDSTAGDNGGNNGNTTGAAMEPVADLDDNVAGAKCESAADCKGENTECATMVGGGLLGMGNVAPGGYCTGACTADSDCGKGGACSGYFAGFGGFGAMQGTCQQTCKEDSDCRDGYGCIDPAAGAPGGAATGGMAGGMGIPMGMQPVTCQPKPITMQLENGIVGKACENDADCGTGKCGKDMVGGITLPVIGTIGATPVVDGYCTAACTEDAQCGEGGTCQGAFQNSAGSCLLACETQEDCTREGYTCAGGGGGFPGAPMGGDAGAPAAPSVCAAGEDPAPETDAGSTTGGESDGGPAATNG